MSSNTVQTLPIENSQNLLGRYDKDKKFVARFYGVSIKKVDRWVASGTGPRHKKVGVLVRFCVDDLIEYWDNLPTR